MAELAMRGTAVLFDIQMAALRNVWQLHARTAAALGAPDYSDLLRSTETGAQRLMSTSAEQMLSSVRQTSDAIAQMQTQFGRIVEQETMQITEEIRHGVEELGQRTQEGLHAVEQITEQALRNGNGVRAEWQHAATEGELAHGERAQSAEHARRRSRKNKRR